MKKEEVDLLVEQIRRIILNKPITADVETHSEELAELQEAILYMAQCLTESNTFLMHLRKGELDAQPPGRHNFLAGELKELHSALRHLTWQANQVASGDYNQSVNFLGDFSTSFNQMIQQLAERESQLKIQSKILGETVDFMKSVIDSLNDWIIVTARDTGKVIYVNHSAKEGFLSLETEHDVCDSLLCHITKHQYDSERYFWEYQCGKRKRVFHIHSYAIQWSGKLAYAHYIVDVTTEKAHQEQIEELAYLDELTGVHNRRFCLEKLERLTEVQEEFTFCMIDLDGLKYANDYFGHAAGDIYLETVAQQLLQNTRSTDIVCRIGGDEFAVLFPNCHLEIVLDKMARINQALTQTTEKFPMSISYGAIYVKQGEQQDPKTIMGRADENMYMMKNKRKALKRDKHSLQT